MLCPKIRLKKDASYSPFLIDLNEFIAFIVNLTYTVYFFKLHVLNFFQTIALNVKKEIRRKLYRRLPMEKGGR